MTQALPAPINAAPAISVALPVFNGARYLDESIRSVVAQTRRDWELIIVDDASTDATPLILEQWRARDPRIRVIRNDRNLMLAGALNVAFRAARGALLTWTSDDNIYEPEALAVMARALVASTDIDLVYCDLAEIDESGAETARRELPDPDGLLFRNCVGACFMYRRAVHDHLGGYDEAYLLSEDYDYWLRARVAGFRFRRLPGVQYRYRLHRWSLSARRADREWEVSLRAWERSAPRIPGVCPAALADAHMAKAWRAWGIGMKAFAWRRLLAAARLRPARALGADSLRLTAYLLLGTTGARLFRSLKGRLSAPNLKASRQKA